MICLADRQILPVMLFAFCAACAGEPVENNPPPNVTIASIEVTPGSASLAAIDAQQQFTATARDADNAVVAGAQFAWTSEDPGIVAVSGTGVATAVANGVADVVATVGTVTGSATVTVAQVVQAVSVTPATQTIANGDTLRLSAAVLDGNSHAVAGAGVTWSSLNNGVATVDGQGLVTAQANGQANIVATSGTVADTAVITVGTVTSTTFFQEGFEDNSFASRGWYDIAGFTRSTVEFHSGAASLELHFPQGATNTTGRGARHLFQDSESVFLSYWVKYSANWVGSGQTAHPHEFYMLTNVDNDFTGPAYTSLTMYIEQNYRPASSGMVAVLSAQDGKNVDVNNVGVDLTGVSEMRSVHGCNGDSDGYGGGCYSIGGGLFNNGRSWISPQAVFTDGQGPSYKNDWHYVEAYFQLNSIQNGVGVADGVVQYWIDSVSVINHQNVLLRTGAHPNMKFRHVLLSPFIGNGSPVAQTIWMDDVRVADRRP